MDKNLTLVVLAAGMGSRYGGLKQLDTFGPGGETLLEYGVYDALQAGFNHIVFVVRESFLREFKEHIEGCLPAQIKKTYVCQEIESFVPATYKHLIAERTKPRGTSHAVLVTKNFIHSPFAVINADDFYGRDAYLQMAEYLHTIRPDQIGMIGYVLKNTLSPFGSINRGVCKIENDKLISVVEHLKIQKNKDGELESLTGDILSPDTVVSMNFRGFHQQIFEALESGFEKFLSAYAGSGEYFIPLVVDECIQQKNTVCDVMMSHDQRCGVSYQEDKPFVQSHITSLIQQGVYPEKLREK